MAELSDKRKSTVVLSLGSNIGRRSDHLEKAIRRLSAEVGSLKARSSYYESEGWGAEDLAGFYNNVVVLETSFSPQQLLFHTQLIEREMGRVKTKKGYENRLIDIDILFFDQLILRESELEIPHPLLHKRNFVLYPLVEVAASLRHPVLNKTIEQLIEECTDEKEIKKIDKK